MPNDILSPDDGAPVLPRSTGFNGPALLPVVQMWARTTVVFS
jgi:hypothetical protein